MCFITFKIKGELCPPLHGSPPAFLTCYPPAPLRSLLQVSLPVQSPPAMAVPLQPPCQILHQQKLHSCIKVDFKSGPFHETIPGPPPHRSLLPLNSCGSFVTFSTFWLSAGLHSMYVLLIPLTGSQKPWAPFFPIPPPPQPSRALCLACNN